MEREKAEVPPSPTVRRTRALGAVIAMVKYCRIWKKEEIEVTMLKRLRGKSVFTSLSKRVRVNFICALLPTFSIKDLAYQTFVWRQELYPQTLEP